MCIYVIKISSSQYILIARRKTITKFRQENLYDIVIIPLYQYTSRNQKRKAFRISDMSVYLRSRYMEFQFQTILYNKTCIEYVSFLPSFLGFPCLLFVSLLFNFHIRFSFPHSYIFRTPQNNI